MPGFHELLFSVEAGAFAVVSLSLAYLVFALSRIMAFRAQHPPAGSDSPGITVLKPIHGLDVELEQNLCSFFSQDYPGFQIVFAVASPSDAAIPVVKRVMAAFPHRDSTLVIDDHALGTNRKISNVHNAYAVAKHDILVIADSDMRVGPDYLRSIAACFEYSQVGAITCLYSAMSRSGVCSRLASMFVNESFLPSVLVALRVQGLRYCFGATMAVRRAVLERIGGFKALASYLADDYMLGKLVSDAGYRVSLAPHVVHNVVSEPDLGSVLQHELRWARTVRTVRPLGYSLSFVTYPLPLSILCLAVPHALIPGAALVSAAIALRLALHYAVRRRLEIREPSAPWLIPLRDFLCLAVWAASFFGRDVHWRDHVFSVQPDGRMALTDGRLHPQNPVPQPPVV
jgi:ceramide glucosyltransferase